MSYNTLHAASVDSALHQRIIAGLQQEARTELNLGTPLSEAIIAGNQAVIDEFVWWVADATEAEYASGIAAGVPNVGGDESVVSDLMILAAIQAAWSTVTVT
jgi:hypothetical protein